MLWHDREIAFCCVVVFVFDYKLIILLCPCTHREALCNDDRYLSVCLSRPDPKSRTEGLTENWQEGNP